MEGLEGRWLLAFIWAATSAAFFVSALTSRGTANLMETTAAYSKET